MLLLAGSVLLLAPLISVQLSVGAGRAHACSCYAPTLSEALDRASAVFTGKVVSSGTFSFDGFWSVEIEVDTVWKGPVTSTTFVYTTHGPSCGYPGLEVGEDFLVFAREWDGLTVVGRCSGTQPLEYAEEVLRALGEGYAPEPGDEERAAGLGMLLLAAFALAVAAILLRLAARPRRRG